MPSQPTLNIDIQKTSTQNMLALINYTFPNATGLVNATDYTLTSTPLLNDPSFNTSLSVVALPAAPLSGSKTLRYNRIDLSLRGVLEFEDESTLEEYLSVEFGVLKDSELYVTYNEDDSITYEATLDSNLYVGSFDVILLTVNGGPIDINDLIEENTLDGFIEPQPN